MLETRSLYVASNSEHDAQSRRTNPYERKLRRKTREDRYEPKGITENEKTPIPAEAIRQKKLIGKRKGNPRVGERFYAENIKPGRLTVSGLFFSTREGDVADFLEFNFNENLGIFKKGKTSVPVHCSDGESRDTRCLHIN
jgi:hypothetical protein